MSIFLSRRLQPLRSRNRESRLLFVPQTLTTTEIIQLILIFVFRQILSLARISNDGFRISRNGELADLPELHVSMPFCINEDGLRDYATALGLNRAGLIHNDAAQTCLLLSAFSEPAMLLLLASRDCPVLPLGAVNVRNRFEILLPRSCTKEALLNMKDAELRAKILPKMRRAKRGVEIDLEIEMVNLDEDVVVFKQIFTMLQFMKFKFPDTMPKRDISKHSTGTDWDHPSRTPFSMDLNAPLSWARICMDYNVLHTSTFAARLFGFSGRIAHGNHALALGLARLCAEDECSGLPTDQQLTPAAMEVHFAKPMTLPAILSAQVSGNSGCYYLRIAKDDRTCVTASLEPQSRI